MTAVCPFFRLLEPLTGAVGLRERRTELAGQPEFDPKRGERQASSVRWREQPIPSATYEAEELSLRIRMPRDNSLPIVVGYVELRSLR